MSDFSDRPFVAGVITGLRAFRIDPLGRLTGVVHRDVWTPGENVGVCHKSATDQTFRAFSTGGYIMDGGRKGKGSGRRGDLYNFYIQHEPPAPLRKHPIASASCECGYYAYFDGGNDYLSQSSNAWAALYTGGTEDRAPRVGAIVNGYGLVTVGSRGFRAEKAEVIALISPMSDQARYAVPFEKVRHNYPDLPVIATEREAVELYPLTDPQPVAPESADDFWTRKA